MIRRFILALVATLLLAAMALVAGWHGLYRWADSPLPIAADFVLTIDRGQTLTGTVRQFQQRKIIAYPQLALFYARLQHTTNIQSGEYSVAAGMSWAEINQMLVTGRVIERSVTLVEGWSIAQALAALHKNEKIKPVLSGVNDPRLLALLPAEHQHPEGWFFADTYSFHAGATDLSILQRAHVKMRTALDQLWRKRSDKLPFASAYEALTLASIIEKETGVASERPIIAGVFVRRLEKKMRLQTDPTVIYGMGDDYQGNITRKHLRQATPYNTYVISGLPPSPIALVGQAALDAAFHPSEGDSLYFVARGDGSHKFSSTLAEHNAAVREYQILRRRQNYRSSPVND